MRRYAWALLPLGSLIGTPAAFARGPTFRLDIPAGDLTDALATLSARTGGSIGLGEPLAGLRSAAVHGTLSVDAALARMLAGTRLHARTVGPNTWRLVPRGRGGQAASTDALPPLPDIIVTARRVPEALSRAGTPLAVYLPAEHQSLSAGDEAGVRTVAAAVEGLSVTNLGPGRERPFIRGVADSPFDGFSQATVSVNVDEARVTYDAPEPGLRLVDVARVEVLEGPQGPLYGTGALGGVYRVVTNRPIPGATSATLSASVGAIAHAGLAANVDAMVNMPVLSDAGAIRLVGYGVHSSGWVQDAGGRHGLNAATIEGGRAELRVLPAAGWTLDLTAMRQHVSLADSQYVDREGGDLVRSARLPEPSRSTFSLLSGAAEGPIGRVRLTVATSQAWQDRRQVYDVTTAATALGQPTARTYADERRHRVFDQEVRVTSPEAGAFTWTAGVSYLSATTVANGTLRDTQGQLLPFSFALRRGITEAAVFADGTSHLSERLSAGLGVRLFRSTTDDERRETAGGALKAKAVLGVTPSASLTYTLTPERILYVRFGTAFRPGGIDQSNAGTGRYDADTVRSIELGGRFLIDRGRVSLTGNLFRSRWTDVQSDYLEATGLVGTQNAGNATILGGALAVEWRPGPWRLSAGVLAQRARLETYANEAIAPADPRLPIVPDATGRIGVERSFRLFGWATDAMIGGNYVGRSRLSFDPGLDRRVSGYAAVRGSLTAHLAGLNLQLGVENLLDTRADTFAFGNPFRIRAEQEYTPLQPRTLTVGVQRRF